MEGLIACLGTFVTVALVFFAIGFAIMWKVFTKAGQPGWAALVPVYNLWVLTTEICKKEPLWFILSLVPFANIVAGWVLSMELARKFGKSDAFGAGLFFLTPIFAAILAFGDARYQGGRGGYPLEDDYDDEYDDRPRGRGKRRADDYDDE